METRRHNDTEILELKSEMEQHIVITSIRDERMAQQINELKEQVNVLTQEVKLLVNMWTQAKGVITFIKWIAGIGGGLVATILFIKDHYK